MGSENTTGDTQGIREHLPQFSLHVLLVAATGLTLGSGRAILSVMGRDVHSVESLFALAGFVVSFGFSKALLNLYAGKWGEAYGRKPVLALGWATALPLPVVLIYARAGTGSSSGMRSSGSTRR